MGCDNFLTHFFLTNFGFNPRTRVGCDKSDSNHDTETRVSIHAPVWGATVVMRPLTKHKMFQSTHPCGVRQSLSLIVTYGISFNPRTRVGCDEQLNASNKPTDTGFNPRTRVGCDYGGFLSIVSGEFQSTHPCGVRLNANQFIKLGFAFQSTHPCGVRQKSMLKQQRLKKFQSTHPCGVRHATIPNAKAKACFNPRTRVGCDPAKPLGNLTSEVSIHAPVWGATN